jgi:glycerol uptake facilitator-like aquaporin
MWSDNLGMGTKLRHSLNRAVAEFFGTAILVCVVVGSGIMGTTLSSDSGVALLINTVSTVLALALLIVVLAPISGAHFNPVVTVIEWAKRSLSTGSACGMVIAQTCGAIIGTVVAHAMFHLPLVVPGNHERFTVGTGIGEVIATAGLVVVIGVFALRSRDEHIPLAVAAWIGSAYLFTSSTSFANPAVTVGRMFTDTFAGIAPTSVLPFIVSQAVGAIIGVLVISAITKATPVTNVRTQRSGEPLD